MSQSAEGIRPQARRVLWRSLGLAGVVIGASIALGSGHAHAAETTSHASGSTSASTSTAAPTLQPVVDGLGRTLGGLTQHVATTLDQTVTALVPPARTPVRQPPGTRSVTPGRLRSPRHQGEPRRRGPPAPARGDATTRHP